MSFGLSLYHTNFNTLKGIVIVTLNRLILTLLMKKAALTSVSSLKSVLLNSAMACPVNIVFLPEFPTDIFKTSYL